MEYVSEQCRMEINTRQKGDIRLLFQHTEKYFLNLVESTLNYIVFFIFRLIWIQTEVRLVSNQSDNGEYNLIWG